MTVEIINVPQPGGAPPARARPASTAPPVRDGHRLWGSVVRRCVLAPLIVMIPLVALTPAADHRFNVYSNGALYASRPWRLIPGVIDSVPTFLRLGNFRPLGRLVEWSLDALAFALTALLGVPANIALRVVSFAAAIVLTLVAVAFAESVAGRRFADGPSLVTASLPYAVAAGLVAAGRTSTTVLFGGLYFLSAALVLGVAALACRVARIGIARIGIARGILIVLGGAALAAFNEMAYLAVPLATAAVLIRGRVVLAGGWRDTLRGPGARFAALLWLGFLPVFIPVRVIIYLTCAHGGCYTGSDVALPGAPAALPNRLVSWLPPLEWMRAATGTHVRLASALPVLALLALAILAVRTARRLPRFAPLDRRQAAGLAVVAGVALLLGGALAALNTDVQTYAREGLWGQGWRDSGLTTVAGSASVLALLASRRRLCALVALAALVPAGAVGVAANQGFHDGSSGGPYPFLHDRIAQEIADFDRTPAGDARRCVLRAEFIKTSVANHHGVDSPELERIDVSLNRATEALYGRRFCGSAPR